MSTPQSIPHIAPRFRIGLGTVMTAIGVLVAVAVSVTILSLTGANHRTVTSRSPWSASQAAVSSTPQTRYLGPRQQQATEPNGARLDHSGRNATVTQATNRLANYPDAPPA